jgi:hypothetical protein
LIRAHRAVAHQLHSQLKLSGLRLGKVMTLAALPR